MRIDVGCNRWRRIIVILLFVVLFWIILPSSIILSSTILDRWLGLGFHPGNAIAFCSWASFLATFALLLLSVAQYRLQAGEWPVSVLPSSRLAHFGLYRLWRHPIYLFFTLSLFFSAVLLGSASMLLIVLPLFTVAVILYSRREDRKLIEGFGERAAGYIRRTGVIIPRLQMLLRFLLPLITRIFLHIQVSHRSRIPEEGPFFVVASHRSYLDPIYVAYTVRRNISFVTTARMFRSPLSSLFFRHLGCIKRKRYRKDVECMRRITKEIRECGIVVIFPEGERSWTGKMGILKDECSRLFLRFPDVPILPLRIEGNYAVWPRWRRKPSSGKIRISVSPPFKPFAYDTAGSLSARIEGYIEPQDSEPQKGNVSSCAGVGKVLYRCPECHGFLPLLDDAGSSFECDSCGTLFTLDGSFRLHFKRGNEAVVLPLDEAYRQIRINRKYLDNRVFHSEEDTSFKPGSPSEKILALGSDVAVSMQYPEASMEENGRGRVLLTDHRIIIPGDPEKVVELAKISSITTEGCRRLQLFDSSSETLYQLLFTNESVLLWQDILVLSVEELSGQTPNRN